MGLGIAWVEYEQVRGRQMVQATRGGLKVVQHGDAFKSHHFGQVFSYQYPGQICAVETIIHHRSGATKAGGGYALGGSPRFGGMAAEIPKHGLEKAAGMAFVG